MHLGNETVMSVIVLFATFSIMALISAKPPLPSNKRLSVILTCVLMALVVAIYQSVANRYGWVNASTYLLFWGAYLVILTGRNQRNSDPEA